MHLLEPRAALAERRRRISDSSSTASRSKATNDAGVSRGEHVDPGLGRVDALQQGLEVQPVAAGDDDLAVDHAAVRQVGPQRLDDLGEVAGQRLLAAAGQLDLVAVAEHDAAEAVPLRLVEVVTGRGPP